MRVLAIIGAAVAIFGWLKTNGKLAEYREQLQATQAESARVRQALSEARDEAVKYRSQLSARESAFVDVKDEAQHLRVQYTKLRSDLAEAERGLHQKSETLADIQMETVALRDELIACNTAPVIASTVIDEYKSRITALETQLSNFKNAAVKAEEPPASPVKKVDWVKGITTQVLSINPEAGLLVLAAGEEAGLANVKTAHLEAKGLSGIQVKIADVHLGYSLAHILPDQYGINTIEKGQTVLLTQ